MDLKVERDFIPYQNFNLDYFEKMMRNWMEIRYRIDYSNNIKKEAILILHPKRFEELEISIAEKLSAVSGFNINTPLKFHFFGIEITVYPTIYIDEGKVILK